jgi:hypothetical protein
LSYFERVEIVGGRVGGASVIKSVTLLGVLRATVSTVMLAYTNHEKTTSTKRNSWQKINIERKRSSYIEKDYFEKSYNYCGPAELQQN